MFRLKSLLLLLLVVILASPVQGQVQAQAKPLIDVGTSKDLGKHLVGKDGMTLYVYTPDPLNQSVCVDKCLEAWPPLLVKSADELTKAAGIPGVLGTITRADKTMQVTYNGLPLYYWFRDKAAGDVTGHRVWRVWWVTAPATVDASPNAKLGQVLVGPEGRTVYMFTKDTPDTSNCYDKCAENWPPLLVKSADELVKGVNLPGKLGTAKRKDDKLQVTYNGWPLYYWKDDKAIGDATGENVGKVWFTIVPETVTIGNSKDLGDFLVTADGMTLYTFAKDAVDKPSTCTGDCAKAWPALKVMAVDRVAAGTGIKGKLGTIKIDDKTSQVTYNGLPLYVFGKDKVPGDATGNKVGDVWNVVKP